jgi:hypothetical protein
MAGTVTIAHYPIGQVRRLEVTWTADAADGSVPATALPSFEGRLLALITNPGATAPTDNYDITAPSGIGDDRLQGVGANRDTVNTESAPIVYSGSTVHPWVDGDETLTFTLAGNVVNNATGVAVLYYTPGA